MWFGGKCSSPVRRPLCVPVPSGDRLVVRRGGVDGNGGRTGAGGAEGERRRSAIGAGGRGRRVHKGVIARGHGELGAGHSLGVEEIREIGYRVRDSDVVGGLTARAALAIPVNGSTVFAVDTRAVGQHLAGFDDLLARVRSALHGA